MSKKNKLFTLNGIIYSIISLIKIGANTGTILRISKKLYKENIAIITENKKIKYSELFEKSKILGNYLKEKYNLKQGKKVIIICHNNLELIYSIFASGMIGMDIYFLNPEINNSQLNDFLKNTNYDFIIHDLDISHLIQIHKLQNKSLNISEIEEKIETHKNCKKKIKRVGKHQIVVLTSGSTGIPKTAKRNTNVLYFIIPFIDLFKRLNLKEYNSLYISTPIYHGFGLIALLISLALGKKVYITAKFDKKKACELIDKEKIEAITLVPTALKRMLEHDQKSLTSLKCIISGSEKLDITTVNTIHKSFESKLFNIYGSSEAGICLMATPLELKEKPDTIGKPLKSVKIKLINKEGKKADINEIGELYTKCNWSVTPDKWIKTGDLALKDGEGKYYLKGRSDDMIVSGGENVYPIEIENALIKHPAIKETVVVGVVDKEFGQRLKAFIIRNESIEKDEIYNWLSNQLSRHQMPYEIEFMEEFPTTANGKIDKSKLLKNEE